MGYRIDDFKLIDEDRGKYVIPTHESFVKEKESYKSYLKFNLMMEKKLK
ncbi:hypothetical protein R2R32_02460 [Clostridium perfringens]|nr:hypothetical protein [Clostridium perfringens]